MHRLLIIGLECLRMGEHANGNPRLLLIAVSFILGAQELLARRSALVVLHVRNLSQDFPDLCRIESHVFQDPQLLWCHIEFGLIRVGS